MQRTAEEVTFRPSSDKGYIRCWVIVTVDICDACGMRTLNEDANKIMDEAFQREYHKLPSGVIESP
jgi:hypothetical protein